MPDQIDDDLRMFGEAMVEYLVPSQNHYGLTAWIEHGQPPGEFLMSLLRNDLRSTVVRADSVNLHYLVEIVRVMYNHAPEPCWGSPEKCKAWQKRGGLRGL